MNSGKETIKGRSVVSRLSLAMMFTNIILMIWAASCYATTVALQWDPDTDPDLAGYHVYYQADSAVGPFQGTGATEGAAPVNAGTQTTATVSGLDSGHGYYFAVTAYNASGAESPYSNVVYVPETIPPTVSITYPQNNAAVNGTVSVTADATDNVGVTKVEYYVNGILQATDTSTPYVFSWNTSSLVPGTYTLTVKAYDAAGNVGQSGDVYVSIANDTTPPTVSVTSPGNGTTISGTITVSANAIDNIGVSRVEFYKDGALLTATNVAPYSYNWDTTTVSNGSHTLSAMAYDAAGNVGQSANVSVTVNNPVSDTTAPTTSITSPGSGSTVSGTIGIAAAATDNVGVTKVEFYINGILNATSTASPYSYNWVTTSAPDGNYTLTTKAYDAAGNIGQSSPVTVTVSNPVTDTTAPIVAITSPAGGTTVSGSVAVADTATDNVAVTKVELYINGSLYASSSTAPYTISWDTTAMADGSYTLAAKAYDAAGNVGQSAGVAVTVSNFSVSITDPTSGSTTSGTTTITTKTKGGKGNSKVTLNINGTSYTSKSTAKVLAASTTSTGSYSVAWDTTSFANGTYTVTAVAYDDAGNITQSQNVILNVNNPVSGVSPAQRDGDINGDGKVDISDAIMALQIASGQVAATSDYLARGDVAPLQGGKPAPNGKIDTGDVIVILAKVVGNLNF